MRRIWTTVARQGIAWGLVLSVAQPAAAQGVLEEGPSLEFRTNVPWARIRVLGDQSISGVSPLRIPGPVTGKFWLEAGGPGVEIQRGRVSVSLDDSGPRVATYGALPPRQAFFRSALFPGLSQMRSRDGVKGAMFATAAVGGLTGVVLAGQSLRSDRERLLTLQGDRGIAQDPNEIAQLDERILAARADSSGSHTLRNRILAATGVLWGVSLVDAVAFTPRLHVSRADPGSVTLRLRRKSRGRALLRSLVFPGLGQQYNGSGRKAFWVGIGGALAGGYLLWQQDDLDRANAELERASARLAADVSPQNALERDARARTVTDALDDRDTARLLAAAYWGASMLDTALAFEEPWGHVPVRREGASGSLGWSVDPARGTVGAALRF